MIHTRPRAIQPQKHAIRERRLRHLAIKPPVSSLQKRRMTASSGRRTRASTPNPQNLANHCHHSPPNLPCSPVPRIMRHLSVVSTHIFLFLHHFSSSDEHRRAGLNNTQDKYTTIDSGILERMSWLTNQIHGSKFLRKVNVHRWAVQSKKIVLYSARKDANQSKPWGCCFRTKRCAARARDDATQVDLVQNLIVLSKKEHNSKRPANKIDARDRNRR